MEYIFECGQFPNQIVVDTKELPSNELAIKHAITISADYVWCIPDHGIPTGIYSGIGDYRG